MGHLHVIGIGGTAMAGIAALAQDAGWQVTGSDSGVYPPMSTFLAGRGIAVREGYRGENLDPAPDLVLVGNAISRGNPELEVVLDRGLPYRSGAEWLATHLLEGRHPVVVTGTHGKTTTSSLVAWLLECAGWGPGFLIGGIPRNFGEGTRFPRGPWVVVEGDEYDTAFFDKRPKFLHYRPRTLVVHNLEFDHADIYPDLEAIRRQFRLLLRTVPAKGLLLANGDDPEVVGVVASAFGPVVYYGLEGDYPFSARLNREDGSAFTLLREGRPLCEVAWELRGRHNVINAVAAGAVALSHGVSPKLVRQGLESFQGVARRLELKFRAGGISVYDDFAHHPTAITTTLQGLKASLLPGGRLWVVLEPASNTMRRRVHQETLAAALMVADRVVVARPKPRGLSAAELLDVDRVVGDICRLRGEGAAAVVADAAEAVALLGGGLCAGDQVVVMSNGGFDNIHGRLEKELAGRGDHGG
ncbi:MAG: UDP-N-acetylmuramate:L-alanyl-gamma-D-glutamyl-meso-diaminopimelate ligase [Magnetococcales bacterium]|nr:UDP-N-acetylmuramate:L-alanyl-gamma-D-glutamyl-meso-diaminopimelate ligase [Magnetococcales bacterium]MBF0156065.1 UDP-N-acetylmuramate:L-alanyl-gamma-D-glutamyl-meso-diaminopimelate ligase [Magnetococcales bacterium]